MKKGLRVILFAAFFVILINNVLAISNPSAVYCENLGYKYQTNKTINGDVGICVINQKTQLDAWSFFEGKVGQSYSYCAKNGYSTQTLTDGNNSFSKDYAVCVVQDNSMNSIVTHFLAKIFLVFSRMTGFVVGEVQPENYTSVDEMMNLSMKVADEKTQDIPSDLSLNKKLAKKVPVKIPISFDWRNYNGSDWMTPVKNQGSCGSCWAFAVVGAVESKIKIAKNDSAFDMDLSEQDLVSCGVPAGFYADYLTAGGCSGATLEDPLNYVRDKGVTDEDCFPYYAKDISCDRCFSFDKRLWKINNYTTIYSPEDMKNYIVAKGPIMAGIYMAGTFVNGTYVCSNPGDNLNHAVVIVGYNDTGKYWVVKNSWGSNWNEKGYFKVGYGQCNIEKYSLFLDLEINSTKKVNTNNITSYLGNTEGNYSDLFFKDNLSMLFSENCKESNCEGYDIRNSFSLNHVNSLNIITYQNSSSKGDAFLDYWNENNSQWESLGTVSRENYLVRYNLCSSFAECLNYLSKGNIFLKYSHLPEENSSADYSSLNMLYLEAETSCKDNWVLNSTWSECNANDTQYRNYYDLNNCYEDISYLNRTEMQFCDYCTPDWANMTEECSPENFSIIWYNDSNSCYSITGLDSDLQNMPSNQTIPCVYNNTSGGNDVNDTNVTELFCGDTICNNGEDCSSCSADCGTCPLPDTGSSGSGGGGGGGGGAMQTVSSTNSTNPVLASGNQAQEQNQTVNETISDKTSSSPRFSLTGLMVSVQNNSSVKIILVIIILLGIAGVVLLFNKNRFARKNISKNSVKIMGKRKRK